MKYELHNFFIILIIIIFKILFFGPNIYLIITHHFTY